MLLFELFHNQIMPVSFDWCLYDSTCVHWSFRANGPRRLSSCYHVSLIFHFLINKRQIHIYRVFFFFFLDALKVFFSIRAKNTSISYHFNRESQRYRIHLRYNACNKSVILTSCIQFILIMRAKIGFN